MANEQSKAPKGGRKLKRAGVYKNHYIRNYDRVARNKQRRLRRHEEMVLESRERRASMAAEGRLYAGEATRRMRYDAYLQSKGAVTG